MKAVIDLGTNTFHLLIAELNEGTIKTHKKLQIPVKLGESGINEGLIAEAAYGRGMKALERFRACLDEFGIKKVQAYGTSAIRDAKNGQQFIDEALKLYDVEIVSISGLLEAELIYKGVSHSFELPGANILVMDIGGGSIEFIIGNKDTILWRHSYPLGAARLIERFHKSDPILDEEIIELTTYVVHNIKLLRDALVEFPAKVLVGSAGSFETLVDVLNLDLKHGITAIGNNNAYEIELDAFEAYVPFITGKSKSELSQLKGMVDFRVEMIVVATILMDVIVKRFEMNRIIASTYSLKEGMLFDDQA